MSQNYYQKEIETMSREEMKKLQSEKLVKQVKHVYENVPYYRNLMDEKGVKPEDIKSIECYEEDGYIIRKVTMNEDTYIGDEFPTGNEGFSQRWKTIPYGKVFNIPDFDETEGTKETSILNKVTFKDGVIISKVDKKDLELLFRKNRVR